MSQVNLSWLQDSYCDGFNIYRSLTPMNLADMPAPIAFVQTKDYVDTTMPLNKDLYYRIGAVRGSNIVISTEKTVYSGFPPFTPNNLVNKPKLWLDAVNVLVSGSKVTQMTDLSGNGFNFVQATDAYRPTLGTGAVSFVGQNWLSNSSASAAFNGSATPWIFVVYKRTNTNQRALAETLFTIRNTLNYPCFTAYAGLPNSNNRPAAGLLVDSYNYSDVFIQSDNLSTGTNYVMLLTRRDASGNLYLNINDTTFNSLNSYKLVGNLKTLAGPAVIGSARTDFASDALTGDIACVMAGTVVPSAAEIQKLFGWAAHKYGLTANLPMNHPYKTVPPSI